MEPDKTYNVWARTIPDWAVVDDPLDIDCNDRSNPGLRAGPYAPAYYAGDLFRDDIYRLERLAEGIITRHVNYNRKSPALLRRRILPLEPGRAAQSGIVRAQTLYVLSGSIKAMIGVEV